MVKKYFNINYLSNERNNIYNNSSFYSWTCNYYKNKEDKISDLTNSNSFKDKVIAKQDSSLQFYYKVHLTAIELNNIVDSNYSTRKIKKKRNLKTLY